MQFRRPTQLDADGAAQSGLAAAQGFPRRLIDRLFAAAFAVATPSRCAACRQELPVTSLTSLRPRLCFSCAEAAIGTPGDRCRRCAAPVGPHLETDTGCALCRRDRFRFETVIRLGVYEAELRDMCLSAKHPGREELVAALAELLLSDQAEALVDARADLVIPIPHHWSESFLGQPRVPETLAAVLASRLRVRLGTSILAKVRRTPKQTGLPSSRRRVNLRRAFRVSPRVAGQLQGRRVLLVDDVLTTGATADESTRALLDAKAASVCVAVIARGVGHRLLSPRGS